MSRYDLDDRTRLLLRARVVNGVKVVVTSEHDREAMDQMVKEGLFRYSNTLFSEGYWWTPAGKRVAKKAWQQAPVQKFKTRYRRHPQVRISLDGFKKEVCHVVGPKCGRSGLWVREVLGSWLVDHPNGEENARFNSADAAIEWALERVGKAR